jgi:uncharacterized phage-associated protein
VSRRLQTPKLTFSDEYTETSRMASVRDVANYILKKLGSTSAMKLQKLLYYCQDGLWSGMKSPFSMARIQAWANGPVIPLAYEVHRGQFIV